MSVNYNQLQAIKTIKSIVEGWIYTNDLNSPTHGSDQEHEFEKLEELQIPSKVIDQLDQRVWEIMLLIRDIK